MRTTAAAVLGLALAITACGTPGEGRETVRGVVLEVNGDLKSVESFVLRSDDGDVLDVLPAPDGDFRFPLPHLHDHRRTLEPVIVELDRSVDPPLATAIRDADDPAWHGGEQTTPEHQDPPEPNAPPASEREVREDEPAHQQDVEATDEAGTAQDPEAAEGPADLPDDSTTAGAASTPPTTDPPTDASTEGAGGDPEEAGGPVIELAIIDGKLEGGARRVSVDLSDNVTLRVSGNSDDAVHVHGYDLFVDLVEGAGELTFEAVIPGVFEIELEDSHALLVRMEVS